MSTPGGPNENNEPAAPLLRSSLEGKFLIAALFIILTSLLPLTIAFFLTIDTVKRESVDLFNRESQAAVIAERAAAASQQLLATDLPFSENFLLKDQAEILRLLELRQTTADELSSAIDEYAGSYSFSSEPRILELLSRNNRATLAEDEKSLVVSMKKDLSDLQTARGSAQDLVRAGKFEEASALLGDRIIPLEQSVSRSAQALSRHVATVIGHLTDAANQLITELVTSTLVIVLFSVLLAAGISILLVRHLTRPLRDIGEFADEIARGNYSAEAPLLTRDEIGALGEALDHMRRKIRRFVVELQSSYEHEVGHLREIADLKDRFSFIAAHELKTPVAAIRWNVDLLRDSPATKRLPPDLRKSLQDVETSALRLNALVNDLLHLSRIEKGTIRISNQPVEAVTIVSDTVRELDFLARQRGVTVRVEPPHHPLLLRGDPGLFREVLLNLVSNAIKYNRAKGAAIIRFGTIHDKGWVEVADEGIGFTPADRKNLFRRFWRSDRVKNVEGTGLGLFIVKQFVEMMQGEIDLKSKPGAGSTFRVTLPLARK